MVTSIEAVRAAVKAGKIANDMFATDDLTKDEADAFLFKAMLRAYLDARGLVMVPKEPTDEMVRAGNLARMNVIGGYDGPSPWSATIAAAPDPFLDGGENGK